ncbi:hypothetical protein CYMTET_10093 [Cymbomonas tetramitiformis]|uniref:Uncharacterized protein n=1 Tax=Cymbomonas tetramitiformis TaxID=36881 RepID=A0AAE0LET3_9CHLO|nr:hypothetical protein CYMTET_10093 [Cymbomonas tetramitiformis]
MQYACVTLQGERKMEKEAEVHRRFEFSIASNSIKYATLSFGRNLLNIRTLSTLFDDIISGIPAFKPATGARSDKRLRQPARRHVLEIYSIPSHGNRKPGESISGAKPKLAALAGVSLSNIAGRPTCCSAPSRSRGEG